LNSRSAIEEFVKGLILQFVAIYEEDPASDVEGWRRFLERRFIGFESDLTSMFPDGWSNAVSAASVVHDLLYFLGVDRRLADEWYSSAIEEVAKRRKGFRRLVLLVYSKSAYVALRLFGPIYLKLKGVIRATTS